MTEAEQVPVEVPEEAAIVRGGYREGEAEQVERLMDSLAAGSAVPVATPTEPAAPKDLLTALQDSIDRARGRGASITVDAIQGDAAEQDGQR